MYVIRKDTEGLGFDVVYGICARAVDIGAPIHELCLVVVGAAVIDLRALPGDDSPLLRQPRFVAQQEGMPFCALQKRFLARKDDFDRMSGQPCEVSRARRGEADAFLFSAERTAERLLDHLHAVHRGLQDIRDITAGEERVLRGGEHGHAALVWVVVGKHCLRLDIGMLGILRFIFALNNEIRAGKR
ncbi:hypothetical protein SDC9_118603 [bioreactor metagenome]|uniref:Uncharacterized protein n=1 Tax=bioreactor metagenome TaxID=1076179 RepID=A0A645C269_9ZZZZ